MNVTQTNLGRFNEAQTANPTGTIYLALDMGHEHMKTPAEKLIEKFFDPWLANAPLWAILLVSALALIALGLILATITTLIKTI